jgi:hypothetical protein
LRRICDETGAREVNRAKAFSRIGMGRCRAASAVMPPRDHRRATDTRNWSRSGACAVRRQSKPIPIALETARERVPCGRATQAVHQSDVARDQGRYRRSFQRFPASPSGARSRCSARAWLASRPAARISATCGGKAVRYSNSARESRQRDLAAHAELVGADVSTCRQGTCGLLPDGPRHGSLPAIRTGLAPLGLDLEVLTSHLRRRFRT